jgi:sigma-B regulation protein RsbU (phosphoserine phosphatase)
MAAGLIMAVSHAAFRTQLEVDPAPAAMFATLNRILCRTGSPRAFFGCLYFLFSEDGRYVTAAAGQPPALRIGPDGAVRERIGRGAYPLGIRPGLTWPEEHGRLEAGETLLFHSDGLSEARNAAGVDFGDERIAAALLREPGLPPQERADALARELRAFLGRQAVEDDVSIAVVGRVPIA